MLGSSYVQWGRSFSHLDGLVGCLFCWGCLDEWAAQVRGLIQIVLGSVGCRVVGMMVAVPLIGDLQGDVGGRLDKRSCRGL